MNLIDKAGKMLDLSYAMEDYVYDVHDLADYVWKVGDECGDDGGDEDGGKARCLNLRIAIDEMSAAIIAARQYIIEFQTGGLRHEPAKEDS